MSVIDAMTVVWLSFFTPLASWWPWIVALKVLFGLGLEGEAEFELFRRCTGRSVVPVGAFEEAWWIVGRRGGKSRILALIAAWLAVFWDFRPYLAPGERATIVIIARDRSQARVIFRYLRSFLLEGPAAIKALVSRETSTQIDLASRGVSIEIHTASSASLRGLTIAAALCDEAAYWESDEASSDPDVEIIASLRPAMTTIPGALLLVGSNPNVQRGAVFNAHAQHHGRDASPILVWQAPTWDMHKPTAAEQRKIDQRYEQDPVRASNEYGASFKLLADSLLRRDLVERAVDRGVIVREPQPGIVYHVFVDWAGGEGVDSFAMAVAHAEHGGVVVLDALMERKPPFGAAGVAKEASALARAYYTTVVVGDAYGAGLAINIMAQAGLTFRKSTRDRSEIYLTAASLFTSGLVRLLECDRVVDQFCLLERRSGSAGRDKVDAFRGKSGSRSEDLANATAGALVLAAAAPVSEGGWPDFAGLADMTIHHDPMTSSGSRTAADLSTFNPLLNARWEPVRGDW